MEILKKRYADDQRVVEIIDREASLAQQWVAENAPEEPKRRPRELGDVAKPSTPGGTRSIFDDIDE